MYPTGSLDTGHGGEGGVNSQSIKKSSNMRDDQWASAIEAIYVHVSGGINPIRRPRYA